MERAMVTTILTAKEKFGLGDKKSWGQKSGKSKMDRRTRGRIAQASSLQNSENGRYTLKKSVRSGLQIW